MSPASAAGVAAAGTADGIAVGAVAGVVVGTAAGMVVGGVRVSSSVRPSWFAPIATGHGAALVGIVIAASSATDRGIV